MGSRMFGVLIGIFATLSYALDAFRSQSNEIFIMYVPFFLFLLDDLLTVRYTGICYSKISCFSK